MRELFTFGTEYSPWLIIVCAAAGAAYALIMYGGATTFSPVVKRILFGLRLVLVTLLAWLLLNPFFKHLSTRPEAPAIVLAVDNSASVPLGESGEFLQQLPAALQSVTEALEAKGYTTELRTLSSDKAGTEIKFDGNTTNLTGLLERIESDYENRNLGAVVLLSDGIFNAGFSPEHKSFSAPVIALGLGDTMPRKDLLVAGVLYNRIVYAGNKVPIKAEIKQAGFDEKEVTVSLMTAGKVVDKKNVKFEKGSPAAEVTLYAESGNEGTRHHTLVVERKPGEQTYENNAKEIYQEVIRAKDKVLIAAASPHPDVKAIGAALDKNENIELHTYIAGAGDFKKDRYDLVILHGIPQKRGLGSEVLTYLSTNPTSTWYITGLDADYNALNSLDAPVKIYPRSLQFDRVQPVQDPGFSKFEPEAASAKKIAAFPPLTVPFARYEAVPGALVLFRQKVGSIDTDLPLWAFSETKGHKTAILAGDGLWRWRMQEALDFKEQTYFDDLVGKTVKYLSTKEDKRKFKVEPMAGEFTPTEPPSFKTEVYNDIYEKIYGMKIRLDVTGEQGSVKSYSYYHTESAPVFRIDNPGEGVYTYTARTEAGGLPLESKGKFVVTHSSPETFELRANHAVLRSLAGNTGGVFLTDKNTAGIPAAVEALNLKSILHSEEKKTPLADSIWPGIFLIFLAAGEWLLRKINGTT